MVDFLWISTRCRKRGIVEIYPKFIIRKSSDLMIRGGDFYAIWIEERGLWSTDEQDALQLIDRELDKYAEENKDRFNDDVKVLHMWDSESGMIDAWHKYCQKHMRDNFNMLDEKLIFSNTQTVKKDYASKKLSYPLEPGSIEAYDKLMSTLYSEEERHKIEWAIGAVVNGDSKSIQKFLVFYGEVGSGKSTVLHIIEDLFEGYTASFDAKAIGSSNNAFALEAFKSNPLVAIQHDGDLSRIEDNTRLNSLVSHEKMTVNEKFKSAYSNQFKCFLFMGTNKPVRITDGKSGLIRRLIDVIPSGNKLNEDEYNATVRQIKFELGAIAYHCLQVYNENPGIYNNYIPSRMLGASNDFYNFMLDSYYVFKKEDGTTMKAAWEMYKTYCEEAKVAYPYPQRIFKEELKNYFREWNKRPSLEDGSRPRQYYSGFRTEKFEREVDKEETKETNWLVFDSQESIFDKECADCIAQYANEEDKPVKKWVNVKTKLSELDTSKVHYVRVPINHIVIDFDITDESGNKSFEKNVEAASKWPPTYAELSKGGAGIHLHYIYTGDPLKVNRVFDDHIEIKVFTGESSLRRRLSKCNNLPIASISSGLPLKGDKMVNTQTIKSERGLRAFIKRNLNKEIHPATKPSIDFIYSKLDEAYASGLKYDVTDMRNAILTFAANSTNQSDTCIKLVNKMKFKSDEPTENVDSDNEKFVFFDSEVFPNLLLVNWKLEGIGKPVVRMINPTSADIEGLLKFRLIGFNCRRYDNHILYARLMGYNNEQLYNLSQRIINNSPNCFFSEAYNLSYTDVYDFSSKKQSLKKFEIELGIHHKELGLPWDQPVPEEMWTKVAEYCDNDVIATEAVFNARKADFTARRILADVAGMTVNDTTNSLTTRIIFGRNRNPQSQFNYRNMGDESTISISKTKEIIASVFGPNVKFDKYTVFDDKGRPVFPTYRHEFGKSTYRGEEVSEGGHVYSEPGMYGNVALEDIRSMHPTSASKERLFGDEATDRFDDILDARVAIKLKDFDTARNMLGGKLAKYLTDEEAAADLAQALKIAINSVYGLTAAKFENPFRDPRNVDNIVAKRGALFMINLKHEVQKRGFIVAHIKTDSIKIPDATPEIIQFVMDYGKMYGYTFEHEATYDRMCLVNDAVYIAKYKDGNHAGEWTATGTQFQVPYVFKKLFSKEPIEFNDLCETKSVSTAIYIDRSPDEAATFINNQENVNEAGTDIVLDNGHSLHFVGKVGLFSPVKPGVGGGSLVRQSKTKDGNVKYDAVAGTKGYNWLESETVKVLGKEDDIDRTYYDNLATEAAHDIMAYGDFEWFVSDDPYIGPSFEPGEYMKHPIYEETLPFN